MGPFLVLSRSGPDLSIPSHVLLQYFWLGLSKESTLQLDIAAEGSFTHKTTAGGEALQDRIIKNTPSLKPLRIEPEKFHEEVSSAEAEKPLPESKDPKEGFQPSDLPPFEDELFEDFGNTSNYSCQKKPPVPVTPHEPLDEESLRESIKELSAIMSSEWVEEVEHSFEEI